MAVNRPTTVDRYTDPFLIDCYTGKGGYLTGRYLLPHKREEDDKFDRRAGLAIYPNYTRKVVDIFSGFLWKKPPTRESADSYTRFLPNADGCGHGLDYCLQTWQLLAMLLGTSYILVDRASVQAQTRADQPDPYVALRLPGQVVRSRIEPNGVLSSITFREQDGVNTVTLPFGSTGIQPAQYSLGKQVYRTYRTDGWMLSEDFEGKKIIAQGEYSLGRVPVVRLHSTLPLLTTQLRADPWAFDLCQLNWDLYNQRSEMRELFRDQTFSILTLPVSSEDEAQRLANLKIGTDNALTYNPAGGGRPGYVAPPPDPISLYLDAIAKTVEMIYQQANLEFVGGVQRTGVALAFQFQQANQQLGIMSSLLESAEQEIAQLVAAWNGETAVGKVTYPRDFNLTDLAAELETAVEAMSLRISPTFDQELKMRIARNVLGHGVTSATLQAIDDEIHAQDDPYKDRIAQEAGGTLPSLNQSNMPVTLE